MRLGWAQRWTHRAGLRHEEAASAGPRIQKPHTSLRPTGQSFPPTSTPLLLSHCIPSSLCITCSHVPPLTNLFLPGICHHLIPYQCSKGTHAPLHCIVLTAKTCPLYKSSGDALPNNVMEHIPTPVGNQNSPGPHPMVLLESKNTTHHLDGSSFGDTVTLLSQGLQVNHSLEQE